MAQSYSFDCSQNGQLHEYVPTHVRRSFDLDLAAEDARRLRPLELIIEVLLAQAKIGKLWIEGYLEAAELPKALHLSKEVCEFITSHFNNALRYCRLGEFGAAAFELRMIRGRLQCL
jgi:hypothetical protein